MENILSFDLGSNSNGSAYRSGKNVLFYNVLTFPSGMNKDTTTGRLTVSLARERTQKKANRKRYNSRKNRKFATLQVLIDNNYCPLTISELNEWRKYDKVNGLKRKYPQNSAFEQWIHLDFDNDGISDYKSPYELRAAMVTNQFDLDNKTDRYKIGRSIFHIALHRAFKSSKKDLKKEQQDLDADVEVSLKESEKKKNEEFDKLLLEQFHKSLSNDFITVGQALSFIESQGERIRLKYCQYMNRLMIKNELREIFIHQNLSLESVFYKQLAECYTSEKGLRYIGGAIFYQGKIKSQKGAIGKCTFEPNKYRCSQSHPAYEEYRMLAFLNNVEYRKNLCSEWKALKNDIDLRTKVIKKICLKTNSLVDFQTLREFLQKEIGEKLFYQKDRKGTINFSDKTKVPTTPVIHRLQKIFEVNLLSDIFVEIEEERVSRTGKRHSINYKSEDIWHILFSYEDEEQIRKVAEHKLNLNAEKINKFVTLWNCMPDGYASLSLNAINKILVFLRIGFNYTEAVLLANMETIFGKEFWKENGQEIQSEVTNIIQINRKQKTIINIVNKLISDLNTNQPSARFDNTYQLTIEDSSNILKQVVLVYGKGIWANLLYEEQQEIINTVTRLYQAYFQVGFDTIYLSEGNKEQRYGKIKIGEFTFYRYDTRYYKLPNLQDSIKQFLSDNFDSVYKLDRLYHPSQIEFYLPIKKENKILLGNPKNAAFRNPVAMRSLFALRNYVNYLIVNDKIDPENTKVIVEIPRELTDSNMRWAYEEYDKRRKGENDLYKNLLEELVNGTENISINTNIDIEKVRFFVEQSFAFDEEVVLKKTLPDASKRLSNMRSKLLVKIEKEKIERYKLWKEQEMQCIYTGRFIRITEIFSGQNVDVEHTIPKSLSLDNAMWNRTLCDQHYNRYIKKNQLPTSLPNYDRDAIIDGISYTAIKPRLARWEKKLDTIKDRIFFWKEKSRRAVTKDTKDDAIRNKHLWELEYEYWNEKIKRFTMTELPDSFRASQLKDTEIVSKYAFHYLKSVFPLVVVEKGKVTAEFRKIFGVQPKDEPKDRTKHSHHAKDAVILSFVPSKLSKREDMLRLWYKIDEYEKMLPYIKDLNERSQSQRYIDTLKSQLQKEIEECNLPDFNELFHKIDQNILINNIQRDRSLTITKKKLRVRGKVKKFVDENKQIIPAKDMHGNVLYRKHPDGCLIFKKDFKGNFVLDAAGEKIPIIMPQPRYLSGSCIRGQLHEESFFGAILIPQRDKDEKPLRKENGEYVLQDGVKYVIRRELKIKSQDGSSGFKTLEEIEEVIVDPLLFKMIEKQVLSANNSLSEAIEKGIYMFDKKGNQILFDKNGRKLLPIRHIRCFPPIKKRNISPLAVKKHNFLSKQHYKLDYNAVVGDMYAACKYVGEQYSEYKMYNLFDISKNRKFGLDDIPKEIKSSKGDDVLSIQYVIHRYMKILIYDMKSENIQDFNNCDLSKRLYVVVGFESDGRITLKRHLTSLSDKDLGKGGAIKDKNNYPEKIRCSIGSINFLIEYRDFKMTLGGEIIFL